jgi:hypothetical protein
MSESAAPDSGGIFISYRREDTKDVAGWLAERLVQRFGKSHVFLDVDSIAPGLDFAEAIDRALGSCQVLLALIGHQWLTMTDENGRRRLDDPDDKVRLEIEAALERHVRLISVLVDEATMPRAPDLPASLAELASRQALRIRAESFDRDAI